VYGALLSAAGGAMYDRLIGQLQGELPMHLLLARRSRPDATEWESGLGKALLAVKQQQRPEQGKEQQRNGQAADGDAAAAAAAAAGVAGMGAVAAGVNGSIASVRGQDAAKAAAGGAAGSSSRPQHLQSRSLIGGGPAAAAARKGGSAQQQQQQQQPSVAEVLGDSWREDSDVNATLGALLHLFGEDLLPSLPLAQLAAVSS
jgi:hypothetical protein